jgi:hypothetical protein
MGFTQRHNDHNENMRLNAESLCALCRCVKKNLLCARVLKTAFASLAKRKFSLAKSKIHDSKLCAVRGKTELIQQKQKKAKSDTDYRTWLCSLTLQQSYI